jgi:hypothetical protein
MAVTNYLVALLASIPLSFVAVWLATKALVRWDHALTRGRTAARRPRSATQRHS